MACDSIGFAEMKMTSPRIAIVGAGMSGLVAARVLQAEGLQVRVFEKSRGCGGRMATRRSSGYEFDHGAQFFTVRDQAFRDAVETWVSAGVAEPWKGLFATLDGDNIEFRPDESVRYVGTPRMSSVARHLAEGVAVEFETRIAGLESVSDGWQLVSDQGVVSGLFEAVVMAIPPVQAASILGSTQVDFPELRRVSMLPCWAVMAVFERPLDLAFDAAFVQDPPLSWVARNSSKPERGPEECWILHGSPEWSQDHIDAEAEWVSQFLLSALPRGTGSGAFKLAWARAHRWRYALAASPLSEGCLLDIGSRLGVCGDWCHESRVEGAFLSGKALAARILEIV